MNECISIMQPWASMVVLGLKTVETRTFAPPKGFRGKLWIHASARIPLHVFTRYQTDEVFRGYANEAYLRLSDQWEPEDRSRGFSLLGEHDVFTRAAMNLAFPLGCILGHVDVFDALPGFELKEKWNKNGRWREWDREWNLGDLSSDHWGWELRNPVILERPIQAKGTVTPILWDASNYLNNQNNG
jgi:hypothetical protein